MPLRAPSFLPRFVISLRIGALVPVSRMFPGVDQSFVAGLRGALSGAGVEYELLIEPTGNAAVRDHVGDRIQRLLLQHAPEVVVGIMGAGLSRQVHGFFSDSEVPFIINDMGADPLMTGGARNPFVFSNTLNLWQSMYALGYWAARHAGRRACVAAALHEAGYGMVHAFWLGFCGAGGGEILATEITHRDSADDDPSDHLRRLAAREPDFMMAFYAGREGISFAQAWSALGMAGQIPLLSSPLMAHDAWRPHMPAGTLDGMRTAFAWDTTGHPDAHGRFRETCGVKTGKEPAVFALLGYETGQMLASAYQTAGGALRGGPAWRDALSGVAFSSPRGELRVDPESGEVDAPPHLFEWRRSPDGALAPFNAGPLERPASCRQAYDAIQASDERSGWLNPYLVT